MNTSFCIKVIRDSNTLFRSVRLIFNKFSHKRSLKWYYLYVLCVRLTVYVLDLLCSSS